MNTTNDIDAIRVAFACDSNYAMPLAVAVCSVALHCDRSRRLIFHVFQTGIVDAVRKKVERSLQRTGFPDAMIEWGDAPIERFAKVRIVNPWLTPAALVRLVIPTLLPTHVQKVIYLDCDLIVKDDVSELWDLPLCNHALLAARDTTGVVSNPDGGVSNYLALGIPADAKYFNSGVLLVNVRKWRDRKLSERLFDYLLNHQDIIRYEDQEVLNAVLFDDWGELEFRWNWQIVWRGVRIGTHRAGWNPDRTRQSIVHFITNEKPWKPGCDYEERRLFYKYLDRTEWRGWRVPWYQEVWAHMLRPFCDVRNFIGRWRRRSIASSVRSEVSKTACHIES